MAKKKKEKHKEGETSPELRAAVAALEALPATLQALLKEGKTEHEHFDGSVFVREPNSDVWKIETSYEFYAKRWGERPDAKAAETASWDTLSEARFVIDNMAGYLSRAVMGLHLFPAFGFQAWLNAKDLHGFFSKEDHCQPTIQPHGAKDSANCAFVTEAGVMGFDPHVFVNADPERVATIIVHEAMHMLREHCHEDLTGDPRTNNILNDLEINDDIQAMGFSHLENVWLPSVIGAPDFLHAIEYLEYLPKPEPPSGGGDDEDEDGEGGEDENKGNGKTKLQVGPRTPRCGSGSGGERLEAEGKIPEHLNRSSTELDALRQATARDIAQSASSDNKDAGSIPAGMIRWAMDKMKPPKLNWRRIIPTAVRNMTTKSKGYSFKSSKLHKKTINGLALLDRAMEEQTIEFSTYKPRSKVLFSIDTSGSISEELLAAAFSEVNGALKTASADIYFISFDAATYAAPTKLEGSLAQAQDKVLGGGGTNVMVVYEDPEVKKMKFDSVVVITDGYTPIANSCPLNCSNLFIVIKGVDPFKSNNIPAWEKTSVVHVDEL